MTASFRMRYRGLDDHFRVVFNEDWVTEWGSPGEALRAGVERFWPHDKLRSMASEIRSLLCEYSDNAALAQVTLSRFAIDPTRHGFAVREWWQSVREYLLEHVGDMRLKIYTYRGAFYVPMVSRTDADCELDTEPVEVVPEGDSASLAEALQRVVSRGQSQLPGPGRRKNKRPVAPKAANVHSWSAFVREAELWYVVLETMHVRVTRTKWSRESGFAPLNSTYIDFGCPPDLGRLAVWLTEHIGSTR